MTEKDLHDQLEAYLRKQKLPYLHSRMDQKATIAVGWPDFTVFLNGQCALIELKHGKGKLSPEQKSRIEELETAGCAVCVAYDLQAAINHIESAFHTEIFKKLEAYHEATKSIGNYDPKEYLVSGGQGIGDVVVAKNPQSGVMGFVRVAKCDDRFLPRWTEALGW